MSIISLYMQDTTHSVKHPHVRGCITHLTFHRELVEEHHAPTTPGGTSGREPNLLHAAVALRHAPIVHYLLVGAPEAARVPVDAAGAKGQRALTYLWETWERPSGELKMPNSLLCFSKHFGFVHAAQL